MSLSLCLSPHTHTYDETSHTARAVQLEQVLERHPEHDRGLAAAPINRGADHRVLRRRVTFFDTLDLPLRRLRDPCVRSDSSEATYPFAQSTHSLLSRTPREAKTRGPFGRVPAGGAASRGSTRSARRGLARISGIRPRRRLGRGTGRPSRCI